MAMIYTIGNVSGAHLNPVVTLGFSLLSDFPWRRALGYWGAQMTGSVLAALFLLDVVGVIVALNDDLNTDAHVSARAHNHRRR